MPNKTITNSHYVFTGSEEVKDTFKGRDWNDINGDFKTKDLNTVSQGLAGKKDAINNLFAGLFDSNLNGESYISYAGKIEDKGEHQVSVTAEGVNNVLDNLYINRTLEDGSVVSKKYSEIYNIPAATADNKEAIMAHVVANIKCGEYAREFSTGKVNMLNKAGNGITVIAPADVVISDGHEYKAKMDKLKYTGPTISKYTRRLARFQQFIGYKGKAREEFERYEKAMDKYAEDTNDLFNEYEEKTKTYKSILNNEAMTTIKEAEVKKEGSVKKINEDIVMKENNISKATEKLNYKRSDKIAEMAKKMGGNGKNTVIGQEPLQKVSNGMSLNK